MADNIYFNTVDQLSPLLDRADLLAFCQQHQVEVIRGEEWLYNSYIGPAGAARCRSAELDAYSGLVVTIYNYTKRNVVLKKGVFLL